MTLTREELRGGFRALGLAPGDDVVVHSSLSSLGWVDGGADAVVDALRDAVGAEGTLAMPTFTRYDEPYDPDESPSTTGRITEAFRTRPDAVRSPHPTKSVAAAGPRAEAVTESHDPADSLGPGSPIHRVAGDGGKILLLGVDHTSNSSLHVAERLAELPYRDQTAETSVRRAGGSSETVEVNRVHCSRGFGVVGPIARQLGVQTEGRVGEATARLLTGDDLLSLVVELLEDEPGLLLCDLPDCDRCRYARERIAESERAD